ncbi:MAG: DUF1156 domain-containing protein [Firmicutes bacterium]|nr:DUF1156 domain-containing protein [Bacillota bacterium]
MPYRKKLIEVALPLEAINRESAREKSIRHGHPSTLHLWWARRPLAACRAVLFASLVDDPSSRPEQFPTEEAQDKERQRLFKIIEDLVKWENINNETVLNAAREEIRRSTGGNPPPVYDPFCGGGSIPLEAQRLGLEAYAGDLNPVAVLITKALIEIPPKFAGQAPINPEARSKNFNEQWPGAAGLAEDVRYYGKWLRDEAEKKIGHLYPKVKLPKEYGGGEATVIAWLWARTVKCPNPACGAEMPLVRSFWLSTKKGKKAWVEPVIDYVAKSIQFTVKTGDGEVREGTVNRRGATCVLCNTPVAFDHIRAEGQAGRIGVRMMAVVAEGEHGRVYLETESSQLSILKDIIKPSWIPNFDLPYNPRDFKTPNYGMTTFADLFTPRQLTALTTFSDLIALTRENVYQDAVAAGLSDDDRGINDGGTGAAAYADAVATYLALAVDRLSDYNSTICSWHSGRDTIRNTFARQAIPMTWDFAEGNPFSSSTGNFMGAVDWVSETIGLLPCSPSGIVLQQDATSLNPIGTKMVFSTDPPYYDNIGYADLSDFFYVWLRRSLINVYPDLFQTIMVPKTEELVATPYRFSGDKAQAKTFFEDGLHHTFRNIFERQNNEFPLTVYYAFKQAENDDTEEEEETGNVASTGWETMLEGLLQSGFSIHGTWPMRSELSNRPVAMGTNALASSIVLVCRPRAKDATTITRREFIAALKKELPGALKNLQHGNIAPVDLAQSAIGPGMAVFSRYEKVLEADGSPMTVRAALQLINQILDEYLSEQEGEYDSDTRWALAWFEQFGQEEGLFGEAETLSKAKNTSIQGMVEAGILQARAGKVRLLKRDELPEDWDPSQDKRLTVWEMTQQMIRTLQTKGEQEAAKLLQVLGGKGENARDLAYRLYAICERKGWAQEALAYNTLVTAWPRLKELALEVKSGGQQGLF